MRLLFGIYTLCIFSNLHAKDIILAIGEVQRVNIQGATHFINGNSEVLATSKIPETQQLLIKGKSKGFSELFINYSNKMPEKYQIFIVNKKWRQNQISLIGQMRKHGLAVKTKGLDILVSGEIRSFSSLNKIHEAKKSYPFLQITELKISKHYRNDHIAIIYQHLWQDDIKNVSCKLIDLRYFCYIFGQELGLDMKKIIKRYPAVKLIHLKNKTSEKKCLIYSLIENDRNRQAALMMENENRSLNLGGSIPNSILPKNLSLIDSKHRFNLNAQKKLLITPGKIANISTGIKVPIVSRDMNTGTAISDWIFIGLQTEIKLYENKRGYVLDIKNKMSSPGENNSYTYNQADTTLNLKLNTPAVFFRQQVTQKQYTKRALIPFFPFNTIDFLNDSNKSQINKDIWGVIQIKESCNEV